MNRIYKWDNLKFLLILLVVVGHFVDGFVDISNTYKFIFLYPDYFRKNIMKNIVWKKIK